MKKSLVILSVLIVALSCFAGCSSPGLTYKAQIANLEEIIEDMAEKEEMYKHQIDELNEYLKEHETYKELNEKKSVELPKKYTLMGMKDKNNVPTLTFYEEEKTFSFFFDMVSDDILEGNYKIIDNSLIATTYDDKFHYTFEIMDEESLKFIASKSSDITLTFKSLGYPVEDQTVFKLEKS